MTGGLGARATLKVVCAAMSCCVCPPLAARAATAAGDSVIIMTLADALSFARDQYPTVKAALADRAAAEGDVAVARTAYLPQLNLLAQINRATINNVTGLLLPQAVLPSISGPVLPETGQSAWNSGVGLLAAWRPVDFGYRAARVRAAESAASAAREGVALTQIDVLVATANAYLNLVAAQKLAQTAQANVDRLETFAAAGRVLVANKLRAGVEVQQAEAAVALARTSLATAQANIARQQATLSKLIGRPMQRIRIDPGLADTVPSAETLAAAGFGEHPALRQAQARVDQRSAELDAIGSAAAPQVDLVGSAFARGAGRESTGRFRGGSAGLTPQVENWAVGFQLSVPLGDLPRVHAEQAAQRARLTAERARTEQVAADLQEQLDQAKIDLASAREIAGMTPAAVSSARLFEEQQRTRFRYGLATAVDVTAAEATLAQAEGQDAIARVNVWRALAGLAAAQGDMRTFEQISRTRG